MTFDLNKYLVQDEPLEEPQMQSSASFEPLELDKYIAPEEATTFDNFKRHSARIGSRVGETIVGFPGDFVKFVQFMADKLPHVPTGKPNALQELGRKGLEKLPTSEDIKQFSEQYTKGYTKAQGAAEEFGDEVASLASALMIPARDPRKFTGFLGAIGRNIPGTVAKAAAVKGAGKVAEEYGAGPKTKMATELGMLFLTGLMGAKTADQFVSEKYQAAKSAIPKGDIIPTEKLLTGLENVEKELSKGVTTPTKNEVLTPLRELRAKAAGGGMLAEDAVQSYHDINERLNSKKLFDDLSKGERQVLRKRYDMVRDELRGTLRDYGKRNPEFFKEWTDANQGYATIAQSKKVSNFLSRNSGKIPSHLGGTIALELFAGQPQLAVGTLGAAGAGYGLVKSGELLYRITKSPVLRKHYLNVINVAGEENLPATIKNLNLLDKELKKSKED